MPSPHRRVKRYLSALTPDEALFLATGAGRPFMSEADARAAWERFRDHVTDEVTSRHPQLVPWASIHFDGAEGHSSPYCHLGDPRCHRSAA